MILTTGFYNEIIQEQVINKIDYEIELMKDSDYEEEWFLWLNKINYKENLIKELKCKCLFDIEFDNVEHLFGFQDGVYNINTKEFGPGNKEDYITMKCRYSYKEIMESSDLAENVIKSMFLSEQEFDFVMKRLSLSLFGKNTTQTFTIHWGYSASNGKSFLMERVCDAFGDYADFFSPVFLGFSP